MGKIYKSFEEWKLSQEHRKGDVVKDWWNPLEEAWNARQAEIDRLHESIEYIKHNNAGFVALLKKDINRLKEENERIRKKLKEYIENFPGDHL